MQRAGARSTLTSMITVRSQSATAAAEQTAINGDHAPGRERQSGTTGSISLAQYMHLVASTGTNDLQ